MARVREGKGSRTRAKEEEDEQDWRKEVSLSPEEIAELSRNLGALVDRLELPPGASHSSYDAKIESVGFMTKNGKPKWKRVYMVLMGDHLLFYSARSKVNFILNC